jgi:spermidine synthase
MTRMETHPRRRPDEFPDICGTGSFDGQWLTEEDQGAMRFGIRVDSVLYEERSPYQRIRVCDSRFFGRVLTLDDLVMLTERDEFVYHEMLVHVPLCSIPDPRSVAVIGGGDCGCIREALKHPTIERVVLCELDERVTRVCEEWFSWVRECARDRRVELVFDDGVRFIERRAAEFDLIVIDSTDPIGPAVGLFQGDFYRSVAKALKPGGVMTAQTESPHWDPRGIASIYHQMRQAFGHIATYLGFIPTYPSGCWSWAYASNDRRPDAHFDRARAERIGASCHYYNADLQRAAFALPNFARRAVNGENPFTSGDSGAEAK